MIKKAATGTKQHLGQVIYIAGTQWGDEGKGKLVDILSARYDIIARATGGANAGHTICTKINGQNEKIVLHLIPSGALHPDKICLIGNGTVIHLPTLIEEIEALKGYKIDLKERLKISDRAHLLFDYHKQIDSQEEESRGQEKIGTTKRGIGPAYVDKAARRGIRLGEIVHFESFAQKLRHNMEWASRFYGLTIDIEKEIVFYKDIADWLPAYLVDGTYYLDQAYAKGKSILIEGAQGTHLDLDCGTYPYVTSSNTTTSGACTGLGLAPQRINQVIGIVKAYTTRVGAGPFPTELPVIEGNILREAGHEYGATTGRPRRCGWLDLTVIKNAIILNGITQLNLTKLDVLSGFKTVKIGTQYRLKGEPIDFIPSTLEDFAKVEVDYLEMPGWQTSIDQIKDFSKLPKNCQNYILKIEELLGLPAAFIGVGQDREQMIIRQ